MVLYSFFGMKIPLRENEVRNKIVFCGDCDVCIETFKLS